jgi:hypothetical protein
MKIIAICLKFTDINLMFDEDDIKPPRVAPKLKAAPKIRQAYWYNFYKDAQLLEFWKLLPVLIVSYKNNGLTPNILNVRCQPLWYFIYLQVNTLKFLSGYCPSYALSNLSYPMPNSLFS